MEERGVDKPKLVVVCTSGGGIAAANWTTLCLAELEETVPNFSSHLRLVTGSSGGMLGAGLYVASLRAPEIQPNQPKPEPEDRWKDLKERLEELRLPDTRRSTDGLL